MNDTRRVAMENMEKLEEILDSMERDREADEPHAVLQNRINEGVGALYDMAMGHATKVAGPGDTQETRGVTEAMLNTAYSAVLEGEIAARNVLSGLTWSEEGQQGKDRARANGYRALGAFMSACAHTVRGMTVDPGEDWLEIIGEPGSETLREAGEENLRMIAEMESGVNGFQHALEQKPRNDTQEG